MGAVDVAVAAVIVTSVALVTAVLVAATWMARNGPTSALAHKTGLELARAASSRGRANPLFQARKAQVVHARRPMSPARRSKALRFSHRNSVGGPPSPAAHATGGVVT